MQVDQTRLSPSERTRRMTNNLCLYCGDNTHYIGVCPVRPPRLLVSSMTISPLHVAPLSTIVSLISADVIISVTALIDSGSEGNFISGDPLPANFNSRRLSLQPRSPPISDRKSLESWVCETPNKTNHVKSRLFTRRTIHSSGLRKFLLLRSFLVDPGSSSTIPRFHGRTEIFCAGVYMFSTCFPKLPRPVPPSPKVIPIAMTSIESPKEKQSTAIPSCYASFADVFSPEKASHLPPHRPGIARLTWNLVKRCLAVTFIHSPSKNNEPWKNISKKP